MSDQVVIVGDDGMRTPDEVFVTKLRAFDPDLYVVWNPAKRRFMVEQCVQHHAPTKQHNHTCKRIYVLMVQDDEGTMLPLGEHVLDRLRRMRAHSEQFGEGERGLENFKRYVADLEEERRKREYAQMQEIARDASKDGRVQLNRVRMLMERHSMEVNQ